MLSSKLNAFSRSWCLRRDELQRSKKCDNGEGKLLSMQVVQHGMLEGSPQKSPATSTFPGFFRLPHCRQIRRLERKRYALLTIFGSVIIRRASRSLSISRERSHPV